MKIEYEKNGDYLIPKIVSSEKETKPLNRWGKMKLKYLKENHNSVLIAWKMRGIALTKLVEAQEKAEKMYESLMSEMKKKEGVTEKLKADDQMEWVRRVNNIKNRVEEIVREELIYTKY